MKMLYLVAACADHAGGGSPTGVVLDADDLTSDQMQRVARQSACSHTAFVIESPQADWDISIRFFTPAGEIKNCGHATIAAHYLRAKQQGHDSVRQKTLSGIQAVTFQTEGDQTRIFLKQDAIEFADVGQPTQAELLSVLRLVPADLQPDLPLMLASPGAQRFMVALKSAATLHGLSPDFAALQRLCEQHASIGCFVFVQDDAARPIQAEGRMFAPVLGIHEDIINGNSSGCLGAFLLRWGKFAPHTAELRLDVRQGQAFQRPGSVHVQAQKRGEQIETWIGGTASLITTIDLRLNHA